MSASAWNRLNLFMALKYLRSRLKQSVLAMLGVMLGVAAFIALVSFMSGVNDFLDRAVFQASPDLAIKPLIDDTQSGGGTGPEFLTQADNIASQLDQWTEIKAWSPQLQSPAILINKTRQLPVQLNGVDPVKEATIVDLEPRIIAGQGFPSLDNPQHLVIGQGLATQLNIGVGEKLQLLLPNRKTINLRVSGIFSFGISTVDNLRAYMTIDRLAHLLSKEKLINGLHLKLQDRNELSVKSEIATAFEGVQVSDWRDGNRTIVVGNRIRHILTWTVSITLLLVAGFGIFNILNITVVQKSRDIAVLKTLGYRPKDIVAIFGYQSLILGVAGTILGGILGFGLSYAIAVTPLETTDFIIAETYPVNFRTVYYLGGLSFGILTAFFSGYYPAKKASKVEPATVIRGL